MKPFLVLLAVFLVAGNGARAQSNTTVSVVGAPPPATPEPTVVTSDKLEVDYGKGIGLFTGNVLAVDPRITLRADQMTAYFSTGTNTARTIQRMKAAGGVVIAQDKRKATAEHADYDATDGRVTLTGNPRVETPEGTVSGAKITFWHGQEKMEVVADAAATNRTQLIFQPEPEKKPE